MLVISENCTRQLAATEQGIMYNYFGDMKNKLEEKNKLLYLEWMCQNNVPIVGVATLSQKSLQLQAFKAPTLQLNSKTCHVKILLVQE